MSAPSLIVYQNGANQVSADGLNTFNQTCNNVAQLRAFVGATGIQVSIRGFTAVNDGGQGSFYWNATGTGPDDGGITNIVPTGAAVGCWTRILNASLGNGTVTSVSIASANGISGSVSNATTTPVITLSLGAITPTSVAASGNVTGLNLSGTNTGDQTITLTGDVTGSGTGSFAATIAANAVSSAKFRQSAAASIVGNATSSIANVTDITGTADQVLCINSSGNGVGFQSGISVTTLTASSVVSIGGAGASLSVLTTSGAISLQTVTTGDITINSGDQLTIVCTGTGTMNNVSIGQSTPAACKVTNFEATGTVKFGTNSALGGATLSSFITITDSGGVSRKLGVVS